MKPITIIVITYNRPDDTLALLQNIDLLENTDSLLEKVILVNNASSENYDNVIDFIGKTKNITVQYINASENLGVTKGRNFALQYANSEITVFLDDDAELGNTNALINIVNAFNNSECYGRETAIVSFKVLYYSNQQLQRNTLPHKKFDKYKDKSIFCTYFFAGGAHAIKNKILKEVGNLPEKFFYGMEEYDLSYRILNNGYSIQYNSSIIMLHKESPLGRKPKEEKIQMMWVNKSIVAWRYLPKYYYYSTSFMWSCFYLYQTKFNFKGWINGWKKVFSIHKNETKYPLKKSTVEYLKKVEARLWY